MQPRIASGTTLKHTVSLADYPAGAGWVLRYRLAPAAGVQIDLLCTASGDDHQLTVSHATTAGWAPGAYTVAAWVTNGAELHQVPAECGQLTITPNPAALAAGADLRTEAEVALANIQAYMRGTATAGVARYRINGREIERYPMADLLRLEARLVAQVNRERIAAGRDPLPAAAGMAPRRILVRMA